MKRFLHLTLTCLLAMVGSFAYAATYSYTFTNAVFSVDKPFTQNLNGIDWTLEWTLQKGEGYLGFQGGDTGKGLQIGSSGSPIATATLSTNGISGTITAIKVNTSGASSIEGTLDVTVGGKPFGNQYTLTTTATDVDFTGSAEGEIKLNYTNSSAKAVYIKSIEVTYTVAVEAPTFSIKGGMYTEPQTLTLSAGEGCTIYYTEDGENPTKESTAYTAPITIDKTKTIKAVAYNAEGSASNIVSETYTFPVACENIAAVKAQESGTLVSLTLKDAQVVYVNAYSNTTEYYVRDASGSINFRNTGLELKANDIINGTVICEYSPYKGLPQFAKTDETNAEKLTITAGTEAQPVEINDVAELLTGKYLCDLVLVKNVTFTSEVDGKHTNDYAVGANKSKVMVYDKFKLDIETPSDDKTYDVTGILGTLDEDTNEIFLISVTEHVGTGINAPMVEEVDENAPVYNLAGQRVSKDTKGILIQNGRKFINK